MGDLGKYTHSSSGQRPGWHVTSLLFVVSLFAAVAVQGDDGLPYADVFMLSADADAEVENDLMTVSMVVRAESSDPTELANRVNATMSWAVARMRSYTSIETATRDYQTWPQYERSGKKIVSWQATQVLQLQTDDLEAAGKAIQTLQERLQVQGMNMSVKRETRRRAEDRLINEALDAFKARAELVQRNLGKGGYRMFNVSINTGGAGHAMQFERADYARSASVSSQPAIEAGTSRVTVTVHGSIQLE